MSTFFGLAFVEEVEKLEKIRQDPERPLVVMLGGAKKESTPLTKEEKDAWDQGKISIEQVNWLKNVLENSNQKRVIIFSGHPLFTFEKNNLKTRKVKNMG